MLLFVSCSRLDFSVAEKVGWQEVEELLSRIERSSLQELSSILSGLDLNDLSTRKRVLKKCGTEKVKLVFELLVMPQSEKERQKRSVEMVEVAVEHQDEAVTNFILDAHWEAVRDDQKQSLLRTSINRKNWSVVGRILEECHPCLSYKSERYGMGSFCINDFISNGQDELVERVWRISSKENKHSYLRRAPSPKERVVLFNRLASEGECWAALKGLDIEDSTLLDTVIERLFSDRSFLKKEIISTISVRHNLKKELAEKLWLRLYKEDRDIFLAGFSGEGCVRDRSICQLLLPEALKRSDVVVFRLLCEELGELLCEEAKKSGIASKNAEYMGFIVGDWRSAKDLESEILEDAALNSTGPFSEEMYEYLIELLEPNDSFVIKCLEKRRDDLIARLIRHGQKERIIAIAGKEYVNKKAKARSRRSTFKECSSACSDYYYGLRPDAERALSDDVALFLLEHGIVSNDIFLKVCALETEIVRGFLNSGILESPNLSMAFSIALKAEKYESCKHFAALGLSMDSEDYLFEILRYKPALSGILALIEMGAKFREGQDYLLELVSRMNMSDQDFHEIFELITSQTNSVDKATDYASVYLTSHLYTQKDLNFIVRLLGMTEANKSKAILSLFQNADSSGIPLRYEEAYYRYDMEVEAARGEIYYMFEYEGFSEECEEAVYKLVELGCDVDSVLPEIISLFNQRSLYGMALEDALIALLKASNSFSQRFCFENELLYRAVQGGCLELTEFLLEKGAFVNPKFEYSCVYGSFTSRGLRRLPIEIAREAAGKRRGSGLEVGKWERMISLLTKYGAAEFEGKLPNKEDLKKLLFFNEVPDTNLQATMLSDPFNIMVLIEEWSEAFVRSGGPVSFSTISRHLGILEPKYPEKSGFADMKKIYEEMMEYVRGALKARIAHKMIVD